MSNNTIVVQKRNRWEPVRKNKAPWPVVGADKYKISPNHEFFDHNFNTLHYNNVDLEEVSKNYFDG